MGFLGEAAFDDAASASVEMVFGVKISLAIASLLHLWISLGFQRFRGRFHDGMTANKDVDFVGS